SALAKETGLSVERIAKLRKELYRAGVQSLDEQLHQSGEDTDSTLSDMVADEESHEPSNELTRRQREEILMEAMGNLSQNERQILEAIYFEEVNLRTVSSRMKLSISRISQLHRRALSKMETFCESHLELMVG